MLEPWTMGLRPNAAVTYLTTIPPHRFSLAILRQPKISSAMSDNVPSSVSAKRLASTALQTLLFKRLAARQTLAREYDNIHILGNQYASRNEAQSSIVGSSYVLNSSFNKVSKQWAYCRRKIMISAWSSKNIYILIIIVSPKLLASDCLATKRFVSQGQKLLILARP